MRGVCERPFASRQHFVDIGLVRHVENDLVLGRIKNVMQGDGRLDHAQIRTDMTARRADFLQQDGAQLVGDGGQIRNVQLFQIGWGIDVFQIRHD